MSPALLLCISRNNAGEPLVEIVLFYLGERIRIAWIPIMIELAVSYVDIIYRSWTASRLFVPVILTFAFSSGGSCLFGNFADDVMHRQSARLYHRALLTSINIPPANPANRNISNSAHRGIFLPMRGEASLEAAR